jgi:hypothetical protein
VLAFLVARPEIVPAPIGPHLQEDLRHLLDPEDLFALVIPVLRVRRCIVSVARANQISPWIPFRAGHFDSAAN